MSLASLALRTANTTIAQAPMQLLCTGAVKARILEMSLIQQANIQAGYSIGRPAAVAVTPATTLTFQRDDSGDPACVTTISATYATSPTAPTVPHRRTNTAATIGVGMVWTFPRGIIIPISGAWTINNITASNVLDVNVIIDE